MVNSSALERAQRISTYRAKAAAGTLSEEDMRQIILDLREDRRASAVSPAHSKRAAAKAAIPSAEELTRGLLDGLK